MYLPLLTFIWGDLFHVRIIRATHPCNSQSLKRDHKGFYERFRSENRMAATHLKIQDFKKTQ